MEDIVKSILLKVITLESIILSHLIDNNISLTELHLQEFIQHKLGGNFCIIDKDSGKKLVRYEYTTDIEWITPDNVTLKFYYEVYSYITNKYLYVE